VHGVPGSVYSCVTCAATRGVPVGVCEPCMFVCHEDHEIIEVGSRNFFRCDCPTGESTCLTAPAGAPACGAPRCASNVYGHNFQGHFCSCNRTYDEANDSMHQCVACGEWYHDQHVAGMFIGGLVEVDALVCADCVKTQPFLAQFSFSSPGTCANTRVNARPNRASGGAIATEAAEGDAGGAAASGAASPVIASGDDTYSLEPWVCCLTCSGGADDGQSICMSCASTCHVGHVFSSPRISDFKCDCISARKLACCLSTQELSEKLTSTGVGSGVSDDVAAEPASSSKKRPRSESAEGELISTLPQPPPAAALRATAPVLRVQWCAASPSLPQPGLQTVAPMLLGALDSLLMRLCRCSDCMRSYALARVASWFWADSVEIMAADCAAAANPHVSDNNAATACAVVDGAAAANENRDRQPVSRPPPASPPSAFKNSYDRGLEALSTLPQTRQVDLLSAYSDFSTAFREYLRSRGPGAVISSQDVTDFMAQFKASRPSS
jgi:hypothetical protein